MQLNKNQSISNASFAAPNCTGFPSPAQNYIEKAIDLNELLIKKPSATYLLRASGENAVNGVINEGDLLLVDSSIKPAHESIIIAEIDGEFCVKKLYLEDGIKLLSINDSANQVVVGDKGLSVFGVVTYIIHKT